MSPVTVEYDVAFDAIPWFGEEPDAYDWFMVVTEIVEWFAPVSGIA